LKRSWIGLALLSGSWLFALSYYHKANWLAWVILTATGTILLIGVHIRKPTTTIAGLAAVMLLPAIDLAPWPYRLALLLIFTGLLLGIVPIPRRWPKTLASAFITAGLILTAQSIAIFGYEYITARSHELIWPFPEIIYTISRLLGARAALNGTNLALYSPRLVHPVGTTWELFLDPATLCFLVGAIVMLCLQMPVISFKDKQTFPLRKRLTTLIIITFIWLFARTAIMISIFIHRALRTEYGEELALVNQFWNPWLHLVLLTGLIFLTIRFVHTPFGEEQVLVPLPEIKPNKRIKTSVLVFAGSFMLIMGLFLDMPGRRKAGRVLVDEHKSTWERTDKAFDTEWYGHDSGYNYACIYDYCSRFFDMSRLNTTLDDTAVQNCDVLIVKVPTSRYTPEEIATIERFVKQGGGLMLVGEHTNVFNTGTYINEIAETFGFSFRYDCLFGVETVFEQFYHPPLIPHPIVQNMPPLHFAVSCSIDPGISSGRAAIRSTGLKNLMADYHASNFYPQVEDRAEMRYGAFVQLWTKHHGAGRVVAFSDSTIFSNFATFEPGKAELMLGMIEWLNYRNRLINLCPLLIILGLIFIAGGLVLSRGWSEVWLALFGTAVFGWAVAAASTRAIHQYSMPLPKAVRPMVQVVMDRTVCDATLPKSGFIAGTREGFGIFERWILRLGYFTSRKKGTDALTGDLIIFIHPHLDVKSRFREELVNYVESGGKVLILDSPANAESTANSLLHPFGLTVNRSPQINGQLKAPGGWPIISIDSACQIEGGEPIMWAANMPIAARARHGKGTVTVIGFGSRFADAHMGVTGDVIPSEELMKVFNLQFTMIKSIISGP
jgi:hypothetical protein